VAPALRAASTWAASSSSAASRSCRAASSRLIGSAATSRAPSAAVIRLTRLLEAIPTAYRQPTSVNDMLTRLVNTSLTFRVGNGVIHVAKKSKKSKKKNKKGKKNK
jgi:hypothetical protein